MIIEEYKVLTDNYIKYLLEKIDILQNRVDSLEIRRAIDREALAAADDIIARSIPYDQLKMLVKDI